ncbi:MAG: Lrp/AsnC family transcriptional regulator [Solirubrobacteraceae bacterium]
MDTIDRDIINQLVVDARMTYQDLGRAVRLSANTVAERVRRLRDSGVISGYRAQVDLGRLGHGLHIVADIRLREGADRAEFERGLPDVAQVVGAVRLTGEYDFLLDLACVDAADLEEVIDRLKGDHGVRESHSRLVLHEVSLGVGRLVSARQP